MHIEFIFELLIDLYTVVCGLYKLQCTGLYMYITVHLRKRKSDHGRLKAPSTSSITYWQIEKDAEPLIGKLSSICLRKGIIDCNAVRPKYQLGRALQN